MRKYKVSTVAAVLAITFLMTGCGTQLFELTEEEANLIAYSAASMVSKYNIQQKDGMIHVVVEEEEIAEKEEEVQNSETAENKETTQGTQTEGTQAGQGKSSLASILGYESELSITYEGSSVSEHYTEGSYYSLDAENGKNFYIMKFRITNLSESEVTFDNLSLNATFQLVLDNEKVNAEVTFLNMDFATYQGILTPGETVDTLLLFQIPKSKEVTAPELQVVINKQVKAIKL